jgi:hypothetical protein
MAKKRIVPLGENVRPVKDPRAPCDGCGIVGTAGVAYRTVDGAVAEMYRYCTPCWPEHRTRLQALWREQARMVSEARTDPDSEAPPQVGWGFESKTWSDVLQGLETLHRIMETDRPSSELLAEIAAEIVKNAGEMEGPMPPTVHSFIREHSGAA